MASRNVDVTTDPTNIVSGVGLTVGTRYTIQNVDPAATVFVREAAVKPTGGALRGFVLAPFVHATLIPDTGIGIWLWTGRADGAKLVLAESP